jgi:hypothetical protein
MCEEERTNVNRERTKMNGKGDEQREDERLGLTPVTVTYFYTWKNMMVV